LVNIFLIDFYLISNSWVVKFQE